MDRASSLIFPGSRTLAGWWRQLANYQPQALWIGYGFVHRIDAPATVRSDRPVDPFTRLLLQAVALEESRISSERLQTRLQLPGAALLRILADMESIGFLTRATDEAWQMTDAGRTALRLGHYPVDFPERRVFPFFERLDASGQRLGPAQYFPIAECSHVPWQVNETHRFEPRWLHDAGAEKQSLGFPEDIVSLAAETPDSDAADVLVDRPERVLLAMILVGTEGARELLAFAVKVDGWSLSERTPVARLPESVVARRPEWFLEPPMSVWQEAWRSWCRQRQMPTNEVDVCALHFRPPRLEVQVPARLVQRLQAAKSDLFKGEAWLLVGDGYFRTAAVLSVRT